MRSLVGDVVYELAPDLGARWMLFGGNGGRAGQAVLVLTNGPAAKMGAHVEQPEAPAPNVAYVDLNFPASSGLQARLEAEDFEVTWRRDDRPRNDGAVPVTDEEHGIEFIYKVQGPDADLTLFKKRKQ